MTPYEPDPTVDIVADYARQHTRPASGGGSRLGLALMVGGLLHHLFSRSQRRSADAAGTQARDRENDVYDALYFVYTHEHDGWMALPDDQRATVPAPAPPDRSGIRALLDHVDQNPHSPEAEDLDKRYARACLLRDWDDPSGVVWQQLRVAVEAMHRELTADYPAAVIAWSQLPDAERARTPQPVELTLSHAWTMAWFNTAHPASVAVRGTRYLLEQGIDWVGGPEE